jgi:hypothetical protein
MDEPVKLKPSQLQLGRAPVDVSAFLKRVQEFYPNAQFENTEVSSLDSEICFCFLDARLEEAIRQGIFEQDPRILDLFKSLSVSQLATLDSIITEFERRKPKVYGEPVLGASITDVVPATKIEEVSPVFEGVPNPPRVFLESNEKKEKLMMDLLQAAHEAKTKE